MKSIPIALLLALAGLIRVQAQDHTNTTARVAPPPSRTEPLPAIGALAPAATEADDAVLLDPVTEAPLPLRRAVGELTPDDLERLEILHSITRESRGTNDVVVHHVQYLKDMNEQLAEIHRFLDEAPKAASPKSRAQAELEAIEQELSRLRLRTQRVREELKPAP